jgi:3-(3-hydroxy-phenyl)propionate hydroxylase
MAERDRVVIAGGGPVGMVLALALWQRGVPVTVLETLGEPFVDQRAASSHPPTIEMLDSLGLAEKIVPEGLIAPVYRFRDRVTGDVVAEFDLSELEGELKYPYVLQYEQYKLVFRILALYGDHPDFDIRFSHTLSGFTQADDRVDVVARLTDGSRETIRAAYLVGCDGGRSAVRKLAGIAFEGFTYPELFIKIGTYYDFMEDDSRVAYRNYFSDPEEWCNLFKVNGEDGRAIWRGVFPMRIGETEEEARRPENIEARLQKFFPRPSAYEIAYANVYTVSQRVAASLNQGRVLLAGDSAHVNNPIGGMGLNGGIHDAMNLADKLAAVWKGEAGPELLDLYTRQRRKAAVDFTQAQTIANKKLMEERDPAVRRKNLDALRRVGEDRQLRRAYMRRAALIESLEAAAQVN